MWNTILRSPGKVVLLLTAAAQAFTQGNAARCAIAPKLSNDRPIDSYDCIISDLSTVENPTEVLQMMQEEADRGKLCVAFDARESEAWNQCAMESRPCTGRVASNSPQALQATQNWAKIPTLGTTPKSIEDVDATDLGETLIDLAVDHSLDQSCHVALTGTREETEEAPFLDSVDGPEDVRDDVTIPTRSTRRKSS